MLDKIKETIKHLTCWWYGHSWKYTMDNRYNYIYLCKRCGYSELDKPQLIN